MKLDPLRYPGRGQLVRLHVKRLRQRRIVLRVTMVYQQPGVSGEDAYVADYDRHGRKR
jgi:hypothetical protein